jgi:hypothetical protein
MAGISTINGTKNLINHPDECPFCHNKITPINIYGHNNQSSFDAFVVCPNSKCKKTFIAYYDKNANPEFQNLVSQGNLVGKEFNEIINTISNSFVIIYNQAFSAEQQQLTEICGVGYRKALEFLIKDYIIYNDSTKTEKVEKKLLGACINEYVNDEKIKTVSKRAAWLGNDETHYIRKWEGKNLSDLKKLIDLTVHWIEMESLTKSFEDEMPE